MNVLQQIVTQKRTEVAERKIAVSPIELRDKPLYHGARRSLAYAIELPGSTGIIAEFKRKSPSKGAFVHELASPALAVPGYEIARAAAISILTDAPFFGGNLQDLADSRSLVEIPLLRKDFIIDSYQLVEARAYGADAVLLIASVLSPQQVQELAAEARSLGLEVLLEIHTEEEIKHICHDTALVGVNNRNLQNFDVNLEHSVRLAALIPSGKIKVAESGIQNPEQVLFLREKGFHAFLIGELFMTSTDPGAALAQFTAALKKQVL
jgi:indole-3-glycerol phosphate synthase